MFYGNFGMFVRALAYIMANGPEGLRQTTEDAVLNANYIRKHLQGLYELPYDTPTMHEVVFSDKIQTRKGIKTGDIAKRLIDYGFHPYTVSFPLVVPGALMIEPTESESKEELDLFIDAMKQIARRGRGIAGDHRRCSLPHASDTAGRNRGCPQTHPALEAPGRVRSEVNAPNSRNAIGEVFLPFFFGKNYLLEHTLDGTCVPAIAYLTSGSEKSAVRRQRAGKGAPQWTDTLLDWWQ